MPPKGKKGKGGKKKSKAREEVVRPTEKESLLQAELDKKVQELAELKARVYRAQEENTWLNDEAKKVKLETNEYMHFMSKKNNLRQTQIVTLADYHRKQIDDINQDKQNMIKEYQQKKDELRAQLTQKQLLIEQAKEDLEGMHEYEEIQRQQNEEIRRLQHEITRVRGEHVHGMSRMKLHFEREIQQQRNNENTKVEGIRRQANQAAEQYLYDQTLTIQNENVELRQNLLEILKRTQGLNGLKQRLEEEQLHLIRRLKLIADLRKIRLDKVSSDVITQSTPH